MELHRVWPALVLVFPIGCLGLGGDTEAPLSRDSWDRPVVTAIIDSEINPYHDAFAVTDGRPGAEAFASLFTDYEGRPAVTVRLTSAGSLEERRAADARFWESIEAGRLYAFEGTRVLAMTTRDAERALIFAGSGLGHGTPTASLVARSSPDTLIVMIAVTTSSCAGDGNASCYMHPSVTRAMTWAAGQPAIDVVSVSLGVRGNAPDFAAIHPEMGEFLQASRRAATDGKLIVVASGNEAAPAFASHVNGAPWVIRAGGLSPQTHGESLYAGRMPDIVANFTEEFATANGTNTTARGSGTSFSTPIVAGTLAQALAEIRSALGTSASREPGVIAAGTTADGNDLVVTSGELRSALNASAMYVGPAEWSPMETVQPDDPVNTTLAASLPVLIPFLQMGWGYVHAGLAEEIARRVLEQDTSVPPEKATAAAWMATVQEAREQYWATWPG